MHTIRNHRGRADWSPQSFYPSHRHLNLIRLLIDVVRVYMTIWHGVKA